MGCIVSAEASRIIIIEGADVRFIDADRPTVETSVSHSAIPYLVAGAHDVEVLKNTNLRAAFGLLLKNWNFDRALRMLDILTDGESESEEISLAAEYLDDFLEEATLLEGVENHVYSLPLVNPELLQSRLSFFRKRVRLFKFIFGLLGHQGEIRKVRGSWEAIEEENFRDFADRIEFERAAVKCGAFKNFSFAVKTPSLLQDAVFKCHLSLKAEPNSRAIITQWTRQFSIRPLKQRPKVDNSTADEVADDDARLLARLGSVHGSIHDRFTSAIKQQEGIIAQMERGNFVLARRFAGQLVDWQLRNGGAQFAAKSLCSIAQEAKRLNNRSLQLEWVQQAVELAPRDARTHGQAGDAYLDLLRLDEAKREYLAASSLSVEPFGATGLARVHRAQGKLDDALRACIEVRERYHNHSDIYRVWALQSEILRDMWMLEEALNLYAEGMKKFAEHSIFWCGYAAVLRDMGRLDEALTHYSAAADRFPNDPVARGGRADTLKNLGSLDRALSEYETAAASFLMSLYCFAAGPMFCARWVHLMTLQMLINQRYHFFLLSPRLFVATRTP